MIATDLFESPSTDAQRYDETTQQLVPKVHHKSENIICHSCKHEYQCICSLETLVDVFGTTYDGDSRRGQQPLHVHLNLQARKVLGSVFYSKMS